MNQSEMYESPLLDSNTESLMESSAASAEMLQSTSAALLDKTGVNNPEEGTVSIKDRQKPTLVKATEEVYQELQWVYDYYNEHLFGNELPGALLVMSRKRGTNGYYSPGRYTNREGHLADEIAMNPEAFAVRSVEEVLSTLAHEMCHQKQFHFGRDVRLGYHNKEFAKMMKEIGLITSSTGFPGGESVGDRMSHYIAEDGLFIVKTRELLKTRFAIVWFDRYPKVDIVRSPNVDDIKRAEVKQEEIEKEKQRLREESGKKVSNRGRKKTPISKVEPAAVSKPSILVTEPLKTAIGGTLHEADPVERSTSVIAARLIKRQEKREKTGKRVKYCCPSCHDAVWGKPDMSLICGKEGCAHARMGS